MKSFSHVTLLLESSLKKVLASLKRNVKQYKFVVNESSDFCALPIVNSSNAFLKVKRNKKLSELKLEDSLT